MTVRTLAWVTAGLVLVACGPAPAAATYGSSYWEDVALTVQTAVQTVWTSQGEQVCYPIEGTGSRPAAVVYPVLNMVILNQCLVGATSAAMEGPVILAGGFGHGRGMPTEVTVSDGDATWTSVAVECAPPAGSIDPPRLLAYPRLDLYVLKACSLVPGSTWDTLTVTLQLTLA
ncbi:MAG: hypothetical protein QOD77_1673 [Thermoplasmata archaeon]|jgi:hypothetical protein|nr:hypothetical protein [Thermoplasmata archaeon]